MVLSWEFFELEASSVEGQSLQQKDKKSIKTREGHFIVQIQNIYFWKYLCKNVVKHDACGKKGMLSPRKLQVLMG